jgi:hypothetical protein
LLRARAPIPKKMASCSSAHLSSVRPCWSVCQDLCRSGFSCLWCKTFASFLIALCLSAALCFLRAPGCWGNVAGLFCHHVQLERATAVPVLRGSRLERRHLCHALHRWLATWRYHRRSFYLFVCSDLTGVERRRRCRSRVFLAPACYSSQPVGLASVSRGTFCDHSWDIAYIELVLLYDVGCTWALSACRLSWSPRHLLTLLWLAGTWAAMMYMGKEGYVSAARQVMQLSREILQGVRTIPELKVLGEPAMSVICFAAAKPSLNIFNVGDAMTNRGWSLSVMQNPVRGPPARLIVCTLKVHPCTLFANGTWTLRFVQSLKSGLP